MLTSATDDGGMDRSDRTWPAPRLTAFAWRWLATRLALPLLAAALVADLLRG